MTNVREGRGVSGTPDDRRSLADVESTSDRGFDRGAVTCQPLEEWTLGQDLILSVIEPGHLSFILRGLAVQAADSALGTLYVGLYRISPEDMLPTRWTARASAYSSQALIATTKEYCTVLTGLSGNVTKTIDRRKSAWLVATMGSTPTVKVRGSYSYTVPSFSSWRTTSRPASLPGVIQSADVTYDLRQPSVALLTLSGLRLRGTGTIPSS